MLTRRKRILEIGKSKLITFGFAILFNTTLAGLVCGTFAWYTYATRATFDNEFNGTTVSNMGELQVGLVSDNYLPSYSRFGLVPHTIGNSPISNGKYIYWANSDSLSAEAINYVVHSNGYATTIIEPTTSGSNDAVEEYGFHLYQKPTVNNNYFINPSYYAQKTSYVLIPFVFRVGGAGEIEEDPDYGNVFLSTCNLFTSNDAFNDGEFHKAVRFYIKNKRTSVVVAPSYDDDGENEVGGILDLDLNGYYDFYNATNKEIVYGEYEGEVDYLSNPTAEDGNLSYNEITSFKSNHKSGVYALDETTFVPKKVSYNGLTRLTSRQYPIAVSDQNYEGLSYCEFMIYVEGWDKHVIDREQESSFNLNLAFTL